MRKKFIFIPASIAVAAIFAIFVYVKPSKFHRLTASVSEVAVREFTFVSTIYHIDRIYKSMKGPKSKHEFNLPAPEKDALIWITGFKAVMVGLDGETPISQEFMCHSNLDINMSAHRKLFGWKRNRGSSRLFTLSQGQYEIEMPEGFGIPMFASEKLKLYTQVLNLNDTKNSHDVRHKITIKYVYDKDLATPMKPLLQVPAVGLKLLKGQDGYFGLKKPDKKEHGASCLVGENADDKGYRDGFGRVFTGHWVVKPGREVNYSNTTRFLSIPYDTTIHYIAVHLHPFAESVELYDITAAKTVFKSNVTSSRGRVGIDKVEYFKNAEGIPLYKDHQYQLISTYNNTTDEAQDSMAVMYVYIFDKESFQYKMITKK